METTAPEANGAVASGPPAEVPSDIDAARRSVEDAAPIFLGLWLSHLGASAYLVITVAAVTHKDLFLGSTVKLPLLSDTPLPIVGFFVLAPISFVILHAYILVHFRMLAAKIRVLESVERRYGAKESLEWRLPAKFFVQLIARRPEFLRHELNVISLVIAWSTLAIGPVFFLLLVQAQFLPLHHAPVTWLHRILIVVDFAFVWWLWPPAADPGTARQKAGRRIWSLGCLVLLGFWLCSATFPGEWADAHIGNRMPLRDWLFSGRYDEQKQSRTSYFSNTLVLPGFNSLEALGIDESRLAAATRTIARKGGHFEGAIFRGADLRKINLENAQLQGADFHQAKLQSAQFYQADLAGAELFQAKLELASFDGARLQAADLGGAELQGAWLHGAQLQGASLESAMLQGATLINAKLQGATLRGAKLQGADFAAEPDNADLTSTDLVGTDLTGADLSGAKIWRTTFQGAALAAIFEDGLTDAPLLNDDFEALQATIKAPQHSDQMGSALERANAMDPNKDAAPNAASSNANDELFKNVQVDLRSYQETLVDQIRRLVCSSDSNDASSLVRGLIRDDRGQSLVRHTGPLACGLVKAIMSVDCPVSAVLTSEDRATLNALADSVQPGKCPR
jgi:uncharacterized protein YjbI with pentapeptide repeats